MQRPLEPPASPITADEARRIVEHAARRYFECRRLRVDGFVDRHFSTAGSFSLHRKAIGLDIVKAPLNAILAIPYVALQLSGTAARAFHAERLAQFLHSRRILLETAVGREIEWLVMTELLELPFRQRDRLSTKDAMAEAILTEESVEAAFRTTLAAIGRHGGDPEFRERLEQSVAAYTETRAAAAEIATTLVSLGAGATALKQITPGAMVLGPALAGTIAQQAAVASFPLGPALGGVWYAAFPVSAPPALVIAVTASIVAAAAVAAAFSGLLTDPLQRVIGLHRRRLLRLVAALQQQFLTQNGSGFVARDHYVARLLGLLELLASAYRVATLR